MAEIKLRYNDASEEVELTVDGEVALATGPEVFANWVEHYNKKHFKEDTKPESDAPVKVDEPVKEKEVTPEGPKEEVPEEVSAEVDTNS